MSRVFVCSMYTALSMSDELRMEHWLEAGDFQLLHNCSMCHTRSDFVNGKVRGAIAAACLHGSQGAFK